MNRFSQKDIIRGSVADGLSLNRYLYCENDPVNFVDSNGLRRTGSTVQSRTEAARSYVSASASRSNVSSAKSDSSAFWSAAHDNAVNYANTAQSHADSSAFWSAAKDDAAASGGYDYYYVPEYPQAEQQQQAAQDLPYIWYNEEEHAYYCGSEKITYDNDNYKKAVDYSWLEMQRGLNTTLKQALQNAKDWTNSEEGKRTMQILGTAAIVAGVVISTTATGGAILPAILSGSLTAGGANSLIGGHVSEVTGGSYAAGWLGGAVSGAITGTGLGATSFVYYGVIQGQLADTMLLGSYGVSLTAGTIGGATGSIVTQMIDSKSVDYTDVAKSGIANGVTSLGAAIVGAIPEALGTGIESAFVSIKGATALAIEFIFDSASATLSS